jgi:hypothetical protein
MPTITAQPIEEDKHQVNDIFEMRFALVSDGNKDIQKYLLE